MRRSWGDVSDLILSDGNFDSLPLVGINQEVLAESAESEEEIAEFIKWKRKDSQCGGAKISSLTENDKLEQEQLNVENEDEEPSH